MKILQSTGLQLTTLLLILSSTFATKAISEPLVLSDTQLDSVSAGYVNLQGNAHADATGIIALADIRVDVAQVITEAENGVTTTVSTVVANASAVGEQVETGVSAGFETDENIVSLNIAHVTVSEVVSPYPMRKIHRGVKSPHSEGGKKHRRHGHAPRNHHRLRRGERHGHGKPLIYQNESVRLTLVTTSQTLN